MFNHFASHDSGDYDCVHIIHLRIALIKDVSLPTSQYNLGLVSVEIAVLLVNHAYDALDFLFSLQSQLAAFEASIEILEWENIGLTDVCPLTFLNHSLGEQYILLSNCLSPCAMLIFLDKEFFAHYNPYLLIVQSKYLESCSLNAILLMIGQSGLNQFNMGSSADPEAVVAIFIFVQEVCA